MKNSAKKIRVRVEWNTGAKLHIPINGKGSYRRDAKHKSLYEHICN